MSEQNNHRRHHVPKQVEDIVLENENGFDIDWDSIEQNVETSRRRKHSRRHSSSAKNKTPSNDNASVTSLKHSVSVTSEHKKKKIGIKKILFIILSVILAIIIGLAIAFALLRYSGKKKLFDNKNLNIQTIDDASTDNRGKTVVYNGKTYEFNPYVTSILFIGVDKESLDLVDNVIGTAGQADALYLLAYNATSGSVKVISISRDTLVDVNTYTTTGDYAGVKNTQICLSYAYGDGKNLSAENVLTSVRRMMFNIPINSYLAMDLKAIGKLNDDIGGVSLKSLTTIGEDFKEGEEILIKGDLAEKYVRYRDTNVLDSNNDRMARQQQYLNAFTGKLVTATKNDITTPVKLLNDSSDYVITNFDTSRITYLASSIIPNYSGLDIIGVPGEIKKDKNDERAIFIPDEKSLYEILLEVYYTPVD
ncbi:MAG: LytR family transcriptional regulator [Lachnospiraceae bacterium]|nr:LytR family transcriptional regulator [Lachnospiraceae bacterium]